MKSGPLLMSLGVVVTAGLVYLATSKPNASPRVRPAPAVQKGTHDAQTRMEVKRLRRDVRLLEERLKRRIDILEARISAMSAEKALGSAQGNDAQVAVDGARQDTLVTQVTQRVEDKLKDKLAQLESRHRDRNMSGQWKAPIQSLIQELSLSERQQASVTEIFDGARDQVFDIMSRPREDGGSLLDDLVADLKAGDPKAMQTMFKAFAQTAPGGEQTYMGQFIALSEQVSTDLGEHLSGQQMSTLKRLNVALLEVNTGHDPVGEYVRRKLAQ